MFCNAWNDLYNPKPGFYVEKPYNPYYDSSGRPVRRGRAAASDLERKIEENYRKN